MDNQLTVSDVVAMRVREARKRRNLTTEQLALRCADLGAPELTTQTLYKLEGQRDPSVRPPRPVSVDELLILAKALRVYPVHLLVPVDDDEAAYQVTPAIRASRLRVRAWIRGRCELPLSKVAEVRDLWSEVPDDEYDAYRHGQCPACGGRLPREIERKERK